MAVCCYLFSINKVSSIYTDRTQKIILNMKKEFIKDTVDNLIAEIDSEREHKAVNMEQMVANTSSAIDMKMTLEDEEFKDFFICFFENNPGDNYWTVLLWDNKENELLYDSKRIAGDTWETTLKNIEAGLSSYQIIIHGDMTAVFGVSQSYIDEVVKSDIADKIRSMEFDHESYIWVNEILNYQGGKNYAIRRVPPNLAETEGMYLSTDMTDIKGNLPYLTELEGVKRDGELYFTYFFRELDSNKISQKLTYAKLYKDFDWVIAMGVYTDDLQTYIDHANQESDKIVSKLTLILLVLFVTLLIVSYSLILLLEKIHFRHSKKQLESEINQDPLTKAGSRRRGNIDLNRAFKEYKRTGTSPCIMMFDIDYFKNINDTYGHALGDTVLTQIVSSVSQIIRSSDRIIRWGGDEFIVILYGLHKNNAKEFVEKILSNVSGMKVSAGEDKITLTLSIGFSYFNESDTDYHDVLKRADQALYKSKKNGCNQVNTM